MISKEDNIKRMEVELSNLHKEISSVNPIEEGRKYDYLTYKIEILKRDIQIETLMLPYYQMELLRPPTQFVVKTPITLEQLRDEIISVCNYYYGVKGIIGEYGKWYYDKQEGFTCDNAHWTYKSTIARFHLCNLIVLDNCPLDLAHKITTYFMRLEEENEHTIKSNNQKD
jgi:hypothetical protein